MSSARRNLALLSLSVLLATAPWLAGSAVVPSLAELWQLDAAQAAWLTTSTQLGFISGTLLFAIANLSDRYSPRWVFVCSALLCAGCNLAFAFLSQGLWSGVAFRFATGVTLAGVYPVGMKIVASWFRTGLGLGLSVMVGALTLGTSLPFLLRASGSHLPWRESVAMASLAAGAGAAIVAVTVRDGPHMPARAAFDARMIFKIFRERRFRLAALGYFGHMWELYAFWALLGSYLLRAMPHAHGLIGPSALAFAAIAIGAPGCVLGGILSRRIGPARVALIALLVSGSACLLSGLAFSLPTPLLVAFVLLWGMAVVADSPQFSALAAQTCPRPYIGTALTIQNGVGFAITIVSIQLLPALAQHLGWRWTLLMLAPGPLLAALATWRLDRALRTEPAES